MEGYNLTLDAIHELGYQDDPLLVKTILNRKVVNVAANDYTSHVHFDLENHYGDRIYSGGLLEAVNEETVKLEFEGNGDDGYRLTGNLKQAMYYQVRKQSELDEAKENDSVILAEVMSDFRPDFKVRDLLRYNHRIGVWEIFRPA